MGSESHGSMSYQRRNTPPAMETEEIEDANGQGKAVVVKIMHHSSSTCNGDTSTPRKFPPQGPSPRAIWRRKRSMNGRSSPAAFSKTLQPNSSPLPPQPPPESPSPHSSPSNASFILEARNDESHNDPSRDLDEGEGSAGKQNSRTKNRGGLRGVAANTVKLMRKRSSLKSFRRGSGHSLEDLTRSDSPVAVANGPNDPEDLLVHGKPHKLLLDMSHEDQGQPQDGVSAPGNTMSSTSVSSSTTTAASTSSSSGGPTSGITPVAGLTTPVLQRSCSTSRKRYITKTSIVQHNFVTTESYEREDDDEDDLDYSADEMIGGPQRRSTPDAPPGGSSTPMRRSSPPQQETEAIECVFSAMSFYDSEEEEKALREKHGDVQQLWSLGQMERERSDDSNGSGSSTQPYAMGSRRSSDWFVLHPDPHLCATDSEDLTDDNRKASRRRDRSKDGPNKTDGNAATTTPQANRSSPSRRKRRSCVANSTYESGRIVHVADIVSTERNFANFLEAYYDLCREYNKSQRSLAMSPSRTKEEEQQPASNSHSKVVEDAIRPFTCQHCKLHPFRELPPIPPAEWPQRPLLLRATPGTGMNILGVRYCSSTSYLPHPWPNAIQQTWANRHHKNAISSNNHAQEGYACPQCQILPINGGTEPIGESLVIDFESEFFLGTLLLRIRDTKGSAPPADDTSAPRNDYFSGKDRKYQAVIRGRFKRPCKMTESVTGQAFARPCGRLPNKWILKSAIQVVSIFAPQLQAKLDGSSPTTLAKRPLEDCEEQRIVCDGPSFLSPLASTPQVVMAEELSKNNHKTFSIPTMGGNVDGTMEQYLEEPFNPDVFLVEQYYETLEAQTADNKGGETSEAKHTTPPRPTLPKDFHKMSSNARAKMRKKFFDKLYAKKDMTSEFDTKTIYTFEFLQHLVNFETLSLDIGVGGTMKLLDALGGQPLKCMGATGCGNQKQQQQKGGGGGSSAALKCIWSFDIWHEGLYREALLHDGTLSSVS